MIRIFCIYLYTYTLMQGYNYFSQKWRLTKMECHVKSVCCQQPGSRLRVTVTRPSANVNVFNCPSRSNSLVSYICILVTSPRHLGRVPYGRFADNVSEVEIVKAQNANLHTSLDIVIHDNAPEDNVRCTNNRFPLK